MEAHNQKEAFSYTYSASEQEEIKRIRSKYAQPAEDKMEHLRRLDRSVTNKGTVISLIVGIFGTLVMGGGMSMAMVGESEWFLPGILVGVVGIGILSLAYPLYTAIVRRERARIAPEILRLTDELMK